MANFFRKYFERTSQCTASADPAQLSALARQLRAGSKAGRKAILAGNGGSAAMAAHVAVDLTKVGGVRAVTFNEVDLVTCFANDYGYGHWVEKALEFYADSGDIAIIISSSGRSPNMVNAARKGREMGLFVATFSGFSPDNPLRAEGNLNFWADSDRYNIVEMAHHVWLLAIVDYIADELAE